MKIKNYLLIFLLFAIFTSDSNTSHYVLAQVGSNLTNEQIIEHNKQVEKQNKIILEKNKVIEKLNAFSKVMNVNTKWLNTRYKELENSIKLRAKNNEIASDKVNEILKLLQTKNNQEIKFYSSLIPKLKVITNMQNFELFIQSHEVKRVNDYKRTYLEVENKLNEEIRKQHTKGLVTLIFWTIIFSIFLIGVFLSFLIFIFKLRKKNQYKKYFDELEWTAITSIHSIKQIDDLIFINSLNDWIIKNLKKHFNDVLTIEDFQKNQQIMTYLKRSDFVSKAANSFYSEYVVWFLETQILLFQDNFEENLNKMLSNLNIKLTSTKMQMLKFKAKILENNLKNQVLNYQSVPWNTKSRQDGSMILNPESMFIFKNDCFIITNANYEIEVGYDKIYLKTTQQIAFKDKNNEYLINFNDEQKLEIRNFIYRNVHKLLWVGVKYENI